MEKFKKITVKLGGWEENQNPDLKSLCNYERQATEAKARGILINNETYCIYKKRSISPKLPCVSLY